ncbi:MAG TPA: hypothetical protein VLG12_06990 [Candidatus Saccharimonadales bacterium]|nr:hypothetical protein [Candidatus Saccharimonadales bacterium]
MSEIPKQLSFDPTSEGMPSTHFKYANQGEETICPMVLPSSITEVHVLKDKDSVAASLHDPRFSLANVDQRYAVTGAAYQSSEGMLRLDPPTITEIRREISPFFSPSNIAKYKPDTQETARILAKNLSRTTEPVELNSLIL